MPWCRSADGRRRRSADPDPRPAVPRRDGQAGRDPAAGRRVRRRLPLPAQEHASRLACEQEMERAIKAEGQVLLGWRDVPVNRDMPMSPAVREKSRSCARSSSAAAADVIVQDALERKLYVIRKTASAHIQALKLAQQRVLHPQHVQPYRGVQGPAAGRPGRRVLPRPAGPRCVSAMAWCTSASRPTPSPSGRWPTRTATSRPQRRDQHRQGQLQLDEGARRRDVLAGAGRPEKLYPISFAASPTPPPSTTASNC